jgi:hypothetical protein
VVALCAGYVLSVGGISLWRLVAWAQAETRRAGMPAGDLYVMIPRPQAWWVALLVLPPAAFVAWRVLARRRL